MLKKVILTSLILGFSFSHVQAKNYYKWVDSKGKVTYSSKPPPSGVKQQKIETIRSLGTPPPPQRTYEPKVIRKSSSNDSGLQSSNSAMNANQNSTSGTDPNTTNMNTNKIRSYSAPVTPKAPTVITNCDPAGCWGSDGTRYNKGAGDTYFPSTGGSCQNIGGQMQCN